MMFLSDEPLIRNDSTLNKQLILPVCPLITCCLLFCYRPVVTVFHNLIVISYDPVIIAPKC